MLQISSLGWVLRHSYSIFKFIYSDWRIIAVQYGTVILILAGFSYVFVVDGRSARRLCFWRLADCLLGVLTSPVSTCSLYPLASQIVHRSLGGSVLRSSKNPWVQAQKLFSFLHILLLKASFKGRSRFHFLKGTIAKSHDKGVWIQGDVGHFFFFLQSTPQGLKSSSLASYAFLISYMAALSRESF